MKKDVGMCRGGKAVFVSIYVVNRGRRTSSNINQQHTQHHQTQGRLTHDWPTNGYNRRPELLPYSQKLRAPATRTPNSNNGHQIVPIHQKPQYRKSPAPMVLLPGFILRSLASYREKKNEKKKPSQSMGNKMSSISKSFRVQRKKPGLMKKLLSKFRK